ncbi:MAG: hypothetical protein ACREH3_11465 [Geminicoccales bacterium]
MARIILLAAGAIWCLAGLAGLAISLLGIEVVQRLLPPLAIDTDALRGAATAFAAGLLAAGLAHGVVLLGLRSRHRWGWSAGVLLAASLAALLVALAAAAATSAVASPAYAQTYIGGAVLAGLGAIGYGLAAARLAGELRSGSVH